MAKKNPDDDAPDASERDLVAQFAFRSRRTGAKKDASRPARFLATLARDLCRTKASVAADVNDFAALDVPSLLVPYKLADPEVREEIVDFFRQHLAADQLFTR